MTKEEILQGIRNCFDKEQANKQRNSMGVSESYYNPYYLVGMCFTDDKKQTVDESELLNLSEKELNNLIKLAEYVGEAFY